MTKFLFIGGIVFFIGPIFFISTALEKLRVQTKGKYVDMRIEQLPKFCIGAKWPYFVIFSYDGEIYSKQTRGDFCEKHHVGELLTVRMLEGSRYILFTNESAVFNLVSCLILSLFGLVLGVSQWKKLKKMSVWQE